ncbi:MAG: NADAR family protein [Candidatus Electrothrix sp. AUS1_2]|nr:NADAR family protein [Candidatus Electrothrix sp. AUS1_2]
MKTEETRTVKELIQSYHAGYRLEHVFFWGHIPSEDGAVNQSCLSQWYDASFEVDGIKFLTAEHYMMYCKAKLFGDSDAAVKVIQADNPGEAKRIGRTVQGFRQEEWDKYCIEIVIRGNVAKFTQNTEILTYLLATKNKVLVEASPYDKVWGIGLGYDSKGIGNPLTWKGKNLLGFALMEARARLGKQISSAIEDQ